MKTAAVFALRVLVLTLALIIVFIIATNVVGMAPAPSPSAQPPSTPTDQAQQAASLLRPLLVYAFLVSLVAAWIIQRSRWRGLKLIATHLGDSVLRHTLRRNRGMGASCGRESRSYKILIS